MADTEKLIDKIRKLLAVAADTPFQAEAETALALAQRLMLEHGITAEDLQGSEDHSKWVEESVWEGQRRARESDLVISLVEEFFFVRSIMLCAKSSRGKPLRPGGINFLGLPQHVAIARYVFVFLGRTFRDLWMARQRRRSDLTWTRFPREAKTEDRWSYQVGLYFGFQEKMRSQRPRPEKDFRGDGELVRRDQFSLLETALNEELDRRTGGESIKTIRKSRIERGTMNAGKEDGRSINLLTPLPSAANPPQGRLTSPVARLEHVHK